jgi:hypothetical protein
MEALIASLETIIVSAETYYGNMLDYLYGDILDSQSGEEKFGVTVSTPAKGNKEQNVSFHDQNPAYSYSVDSQPDSTFGQADLDDASLADFFKRPIKIASYNWATNTQFFESFNPWTLYFENKRIINRIANFALLRAKLHIKVLINGNGFHYGRAILSYHPLHREDGFTVSRGFYIQDIVGASQRPHIYIDPTTSQGGDMVLPFFFYKNALSIPENEWNEMGEMVFQSLNDLKHANGATDRVTVSVFAWAEDVTLSMPTASNPLNLSPQCGYELLDPQADEYGSNPISGPASLVSRWAGALNKAPYIGPYARATELAASAVSSIAKVFGYSRPAILSDINPYKPTYLGNLANSNMPDSCQRLTMDAKQEVTIDPRTVGLSTTDEMAITPLACRESYVTTFPWRISDSSEKLLWNSEVTPIMWSSLNTEIHMTPSCWVSIPFHNWRGSMEFRFQIVASQYHKGRIKIVWDPYYPSSNEYATNYTWILDIAEEKDATVKIGWGNQRSYCTSDTPGRSTEPYSTSKITTAPTASANGILSVYVVNELTVPNSTINNDIAINVFTKMCDDFEVANPDSDKLERFSWFLSKLPVSADEPEFGESRFSQFASEMLEPQSGEVNLADQEDTKEPSAPMSTIVDETLADVTLDRTDHALDVYFGEQIVSLRQALKRYNYHTSFGVDQLGHFFLKRTSNNLPFHRGFAPGGIHKYSLHDINYCKMTMMNWVIPAYTGWRGSVRWKYHRARETQQSFPAIIRNAVMTIRRVPTDVAAYTLRLREWFFFTDQSLLAYNSVSNTSHTWDGAAATNMSGNPVLEVELPWYSNNRFSPAKRANLTDFKVLGHWHQFETPVACSQNNSQEKNGTTFDTYCATGEDFSLFFFTGAPVCYFVGPDDPEP